MIDLWSIAMMLSGSGGRHSKAPHFLLVLEQIRHLIHDDLCFSERVKTFVNMRPDLKRTASSPSSFSDRVLRQPSRSAHQRPIQPIIEL
jgi:hypothetical protein